MLKGFKMLGWGVFFLWGGGGGGGVGSSVL